MTNSKKNFLVTFSFFLIIPFALFAENESRDLEKKIQARRTEYINWIGDTFGEMELAMAPNDESPLGSKPCTLAFEERC